MLRISNIKLRPDHTKADLQQKIASKLRIPEQEIGNWKIVKQSIDARKKPDIWYIYTVDVAVKKEEQLLRRQKGNEVSKAPNKQYVFPCVPAVTLPERPVVIGSGPAGLFCAYMLAIHGHRPIIIERGAKVEERQKDVETFWQTGVLNPNSNVQFGEGGAGTFSDGKLNTLIKDKDGRNRKVLEIFVEHGAPEEILYVNKPHIGTDILIEVVRQMRQTIERHGGTFYFHTCFQDFTLEDGHLTAITVQDAEQVFTLSASTLVLAIGHSARDTFQMLYERGLPLSAKPFAVGLRVEHLQQEIQEAQYGADCPYHLPAAPYKLATTLPNGRGVYSFCMCPGGYVVNASSEENRLAVNGMSYHGRAGKNANSAIIVTISPEDYGDGHPLSGIAFQRDLEERAYQEGKGKIPVQRYEDYCQNRQTTAFGKVLPQMKGQYAMANVRQILPDYIGDSIAEGIRIFERQIPGFSGADTLLSGVESRTSSPVKITRNDQLQVAETGIYPCGEGAGYAGGITSAAADGIRIAEQIVRNCQNLFTKK